MLAFELHETLVDAATPDAVAGAVLKASGDCEVVAAALFDVQQFRRGHCAFPINAGMEFAQNYARAGVFDGDRILQMALTTGSPFQWSVGAYDRSVHPTLREMMDHARDVGIIGGLAVPIYGPDGLEGVMNFGRASDDVLSPSAVARLSYLGIHGYRRVADALRPGESQREIRLAPREIECLQWVAAGFDCDSVGERMALSSRTVEAYLRNAALKLNAVTRPQAVAEAIRRGLIS